MQRPNALGYFTRWGALSLAVYAGIALGAVMLILRIGNAPGDASNAMIYRSVIEVAVVYMVVGLLMFAGAGALIGWVSRSYPTAPRPMLARATTFLAIMLGGAVSWMSGGVLLPLVIALTVICWRWWQVAPLPEKHS